MNVTKAHRAPLSAAAGGTVIALAGVAGGYAAPVGEYCAAPFLPQLAAVQQDKAQANGSTLTTHYADACWAAAAQQSALWWGLIVLGVAIAVLSLGWLLVPGNARPALRRGAAALGAGGVLLFVGVVGGWAVPVGQDCSGAFGDQGPARIVALKTGSSEALKACQSAASGMAAAWSALIAIACAVLVLAVVLLILAVVRMRRARGAGGAQITAGGWRDVWRNGPRWPLVLGSGVIAAAVLCGFAVPVGPYCSGAFTSQGSAVSQDFYQAMSYNRMSDYAATCGASAAQMAVLWWVLIAAGVALMALAFVLRRRFLQQFAAAGYPAPVPARVVPAAAQQAPMPPAAPATAAPAAMPAVFSVAGELSKLAALRDQGILTQDEFEQQKARLLAL